MIQVQLQVSAWRVSGTTGSCPLIATGPCPVTAVCRCFKERNWATSLVVVLWYGAAV